MLITRNLTPYGETRLKAFRIQLPESEYVKKEKWSRGKPFDLERDLATLFAILPKYHGVVYGEDGKKTAEYQNFKERNVQGLWFVSNQHYRALRGDYPRWDGHILLDLDSKPDPIYSTIYKLLAESRPPWMRMVKWSGSGSLHILCHTEVADNQKTKIFFQSAFDTFVTLMKNFLRSHHIILGDDIKIDTACRQISQGMALWNAEYVLNQNNKDYNVFRTTEFAEALQRNLSAERHVRESNSIRKSHKAIAAVTSSRKYEFAYDTTDAVGAIWKTTSEKEHAPYSDRLAVVMALHHMGVREDEVYDICSWGFPENHLESVRGWYRSASTSSEVYTERNINMLRQYLDACHIKYTIRPLIALDKGIRRLFNVKYETYVKLASGEYLTGSLIKERQTLLQILETKKDIIYIDAAPGSGKTEFAKFLMRTGRRVCYACGRNTVLISKFQRLDVIRCYGTYAKEADTSDKRRSVCCSLNWLAQNFKQTDGAFDFIIIDEIHLTDETFRKELMLKLLEHISNYHNNGRSKTKMILMTATPSIEVNYLDQNKTHYVKVVKPLRFAKTITPCISKDYPSAVGAMIKDIQSVVAAGRKVLVCENNIKRNSILADYLANSGIHLVDFNRKQRHSEEVRYVLEHATVPSGFDGILVTSYFGVGCEIKDSNEWEVFFLPLRECGFRANDIEQFANRIRNRRITARIYYHGMVNISVVDGNSVKVLDALSRQKYKEYLQIFESEQHSQGVDMKVVTKALVRYIDSEEVKYDTFTFQAAMYEGGVGTTMSLLTNEYKWIVEDTVYIGDSTAVDLSDSRERMNDDNIRKYREAYKDMCREYSVPLAGHDEGKVFKKLENIEKGVREYEREWVIRGESIFDLELVKNYKFYTDYHREIASSLLKYGRGYLMCEEYVYEGVITRGDLRRIIARRNLIAMLDGRGMDFFAHMADFINTSALPFNRNALSKGNFAILTEHIASMFRDRPLTVAEEIARRVVALCRKDRNGLLRLDLDDFDPGINIIEEVKRLVEEKAERKRMQNRGANRKYRAKMKSGASMV